MKPVASLANTAIKNTKKTRSDRPKLIIELSKNGFDQITRGIEHFTQYSTESTFVFDLQAGRGRSEFLLSYLTHEERENIISNIIKQLISEEFAVVRKHALPVDELHISWKVD